MTKTADSEVSKRGEEDELLCGGEDGELERFFLFLSFLVKWVGGGVWLEGRLASVLGVEGIGRA